MKLLLLLLSAVVLCHGTDPARLASKDYCQMGCVNGDCIADHGAFKCSCYDNWFGDNCTQHICSKVVEDNGDPLCQNEGICLTNPNNVSDYLCSCPLGFTGRNCQYKTHGDACASNPCSENGTCYNRASGGFECICNPGAYGITCNITSNFLCTQPGVENCFGHGECVIIYQNGGPFPQCRCYTDYDPSSKCKFRDRRDICKFDMPCQHGGICSYVNGGFYSCECPLNKTGVNCTEDFNVCAPNPCEANGTCSPAFGGHYYQCSCPNNRQGYNCEYVVDPCLGKCGEGVECVIHSQPETNRWYSSSAVTECLDCVESHDHCSSAPCGTYGTCTSTDASYVCECQSGRTGQNCTDVDHCSMKPCSHSTNCLNHPEGNGFVCICSTGWGGELCDKDIDECLGDPDFCNGGSCVNRLGTYSCESCPRNMAGTNCERPLTCEDMTCMNGGTCLDTGGVVNCTCPDGFTGSTCEDEICPHKEHCDSIAGNGMCDYDCYTAACSYDGGDNCTLNPNSTNPWASCRHQQFCRQTYADGKCDVQCNTKECLYDGGDCQPKCSSKEACVVAMEDGRCSLECNNQECPFDHVDCGGTPNFLKDELVLILVTSRETPFSEPYRTEFLEILGNITNTIPSVIESKVITRDEAMKYPVNLNIINAQEPDILIYLVRLRLDIRLCRSNCPTNTQDVIRVIEANYESGNPKIGNFAPASAYDQPPDDSNPGLSNAVIGVIGGVVVVVISIVVVAGVLLGKRKIHAKIWRPHSPASESDNASTSQGTDGRRRGSQAGGAVTGTEPSSLQRSDSDDYMQKGAKKAKMLPNGGDAHIEYVPIDGRYELVRDSRQWNPAHYEAFRNPRRVHDLLLGYKQQHGENLDVNATGPGGFTPLMLVVMKRHSSHENIPYNSRTSSVSSEHQMFAAPYCTPYHDRMALMNGAAAGGRPISNGSMLSHDGCFYTPHGFIPPIESSVATLLKSNVDLNATNDFGQTALHLAAACSRADYVEQLLEAGANPNVGDNWGQSALQVAIGAGAEGSFMILINHPKTDLNLKSDGGITPLMAAVKVVNQYMLKLLIKKSADIAATDNDGRTALHWAAMVDNLEALKLLIRHGPETIKDAQDNKGQTALFLACREGSYGCVKHLIDCFANATLLDNLDQSPVQIAMQKQHLDIVALLQTQGPISYPPRVNIPYRPPGSHLEQEAMYPYPATSRPLIKPFKSKSRQEHRNLTDHSVGHTHITYAQQPYFGGMPSTSHDHTQQTFGDLIHLPISTDPSSIPMTALGPSSYSNAYSSGAAAAAAVASVSSVTSTVPNQQPLDGGSPPTCMGANSVVNTHPVMANYLMSNSDQLQQSTTPPSQYASPQSAGYGNPSPGYESELTTEFIGADPITATSSAAGVVMSQSQLSPQSYNHLPSTSAVVSSSQQLPSYNSRFTSYNGMEQHSTAPPVSVYGSSTGSTRPLQHLPYVAEPSMSQGPPPLVSSDQTYHHRTSPPHMGSVSSGSPSSAYPSPLQPNNELHANFIHNGYASSRTSPPSLTPSPESREDQLVNAHGTFHVEHHPQDFTMCHTHIQPDTGGMTMV